MSTFTINQTPEEKNIYLYPTGSSATELTAIGSDENWDCVNDTRISYDTNTYVYNNTTSTLTDLYTVDDTSVSSGDINSVTVYVRGKSETYNQEASGIYAIVFDDGHGNKTYGTNHTNTTGWTLWSENWSSKPSDSSSWTWTDIDEMLVGIECSSPLVVGGNTNLLLEPNAAGDLSNLSKYNCSNNYECVDTAYDNEYVYNHANSNWLYDLYNIPNHTTESGTINYLTIYARMGTNLINTSNAGIIKCKLGGTISPSGVGDQFYLSNIWKYYSWKMTSQPSNSAAWTWDEVDQIQIGGGLHTINSVGKYTYFDHAYLLVNYDADVSPDIKTTQMFVRVNYIPTTTTATLNKPSSYSISHGRTIKSHNFWNETRAVYGVQRNNKTLNMSGSEWGSNAITRLDAVRDMAEEGGEIDIDDIGDRNVDTSWILKSFTYNEDESTQGMYNWSLVAEKA